MRAHMAQQRSATKRGSGRRRPAQADGRAGRAPASRPPARRRWPPKPGRRLGWRLLRWAGFSALLLLIAVAGLVGWLAYGLPDVSQLDEARRPSVTLLSNVG